jgi:hypothetical protein
MGQLTMRQWGNGVVERWTMGPWTLVQWTHGLLDRGTVSMEQWATGESNPGALGHWGNGARGPWTTGQCTIRQCQGSTALDA